MTQRTGPNVFCDSAILITRQTPLNRCVHWQEILQGCFFPSALSVGFLAVPAMTMGAAYDLCRKYASIINIVAFRFGIRVSIPLKCDPRAVRSRHAFRRIWPEHLVLLGKWSRDLVERADKSPCSARAHSHVLRKRFTLLCLKPRWMAAANWSTTPPLSKLGRDPGRGTARAGACRCCAGNKLLP